jgi:hypothetical protein
VPAIPKRLLHQGFLDALGAGVRSHSAAAEIPLTVEIASRVKLAVFAFTLTPSNSATNRPTGEYKAQLTVPRPQRERGTKCRLPVPEGTVPIIVAWSPIHDVFVLWDGHAHEEFGYSKNMQVKEAALVLAQTHGIQQMTRRLPRRGGRMRGVETVIVARKDYLPEAIKVRIRLSAEREESLATGS